MPLAQKTSLGMHWTLEEAWSHQAIHAASMLSFLEEAFKILSLAHGGHRWKRLKHSIELVKVDLHAKQKGEMQTAKAALPSRTMPHTVVSVV